MNLNMEMKEYKLGDLIEVTRGMSLPGEFYSTEGEYIRLTCGNFDYVNNSFKENKSKDDLYYVGKVKPEFIMQKGDIITPLTEQAIGLLGSTAIIPESGKYIQSQDVAKVTCKKGMIDHDFAYYLIPSKCVKEQLSAAAQQTKIRHTSPDAIKACKVFVPPLSEQKKIASVLSALDDKIALNKKMNQKLEAMAKRLYDYWFVQYDFPDKNGHPYKTTGGPMTYNPTLKREIPAGWEVLPIGDILDKYKTTKKFNTSDYKTNGKYPIVDQDTSTFIAGYTDDEDVLKRFPAVLFGDHSTCVKFLNFEFGRGADGTQILYSKNERIHQFYLYMAIKSMSIPNPGYARHFKFLKEMPIILPCQKLADEYQKRMEPIYAAITKVDLESRAIIRLRDKLLPLLMNGQVEVK